MPLLKTWLWLSATASVAGWLLSALGQLNRTGYVAFGMTLAFALVCLRKPLALTLPRFQCNFSRLRWRVRHLLPAGFALLAFLVFLAGALYPPNNHTGLTYRTARVLQWLAADHWHWIHTGIFRMNDRACGIEWLTAPLLLFTRSDRALFLLNFIPFLLLPGLLFSVFTRLGVHPRAAWHWMWLLPTGYSFLLQSSNTANDTFPAVYALAAIDFASRAWSSRRASDLAYSLIAAALLTGAKASNIPLLLPWAIVAAPLVPKLKFKIAPTLLLLLLTAIVSFLPTAILNTHYCGDWSGLILENAGMNMKNPIVGLWGNPLLFLLDNLVPPFFPMAGWWNQHALTLLPQAIVQPMTANFEAGFHLLWELPNEDWVGIGFGLSWLLFFSVTAAWWLDRKQNPPHHEIHETHERNGTCHECSAHPEIKNVTPHKPEQRLGPGRLHFRVFRVFRGLSPRPTMPTTVRMSVIIGAWVALAGFCVKSGMVNGARLIAPYYGLLLPLLLLSPSQAVVVRKRWWKIATVGVLLLALPVLILNPARPLWPARTSLKNLVALRPADRLLTRALNVYTVYAKRSDPLADVRALLPPGLDRVGFLASTDDMDISLWRPFFTRRVEHVLLEDTGDLLRRRHIRCVVVGSLHLKQSGVTLQDWLERVGADLVATTSATIKVSEGPQAWHLVRLR